MNSKFLAICLRGIALFLLLALVSSAVIPVLAAPGETRRQSVDSAGVQANGGSHRSSVSSDGRFVAFESGATNLVAGDTNGTSDIFVHDNQTGETTRVSLDSAGVEANGGSAGTAISGDGRFVAFSSSATNLVGGDTNNLDDIFVKDRQTGTTTRASVSSSGEQSNDNSDWWLSISADGRFVAFLSDATNLVPGDTNGATDMFVHDNQTGVTERVSVANDGTEASGGSFALGMFLSADGRYAVFASGATNLVSGDTNAASDVFVRDRQAGTTTRASVNSSGVEANKGGTEPSLSGNGRYVTFSSTSTNLLPFETSSNEHLYVHDLQTGATNLVSIQSDGYEMIGRAEQSVISGDGRYVAFQFDDRGDGAAFFAIYVHDNLTGATKGISGHGIGVEDSSFLPAISGDGRFVAFTSASSRLVAGDTNGVDDIFLHEVNLGPDLNPTVSSVQPTCSGSFCKYPSPDTVSFRVTFSELVTGVGVDDFAVTMSGGVSGAAVTNVRSISGSGGEYLVDVGTGTGDGTLRLDVVDNDTIQDTSLNPLGGPGTGNGNFNTGGLYTVDKSLPAVTSIIRTDPTPTAADTVHFAVTFSEAVTGVDGSDFTLAPTGNITSFGLTQVDGSGASYVVTVNTGTGDGTLRLGIADDDSIVDVVGNHLGGAGVGNGNFDTGETYSINRNAPLVVSSVRADSNPTSAEIVHFTVTFSEPVTGVDPADFLVSATGVSGASVLQVSGSDIVYFVNVGTGTGNGDLRLDLLDNDSILDLVGLPLGGAGLGNGNFTTGEAYTMTRSLPPPPSLVTETFRSTGASDGWVLESSEDSNVGGSTNGSAPVFRLGDDAQDRQYRAILHFPTYYLPDNAVVTQVILMIKNQGVMGNDPFTTHQNVQVDISRGLFGFNAFFGLFSLQPSDFQAIASRDAVGVISNNPVGGWYWSVLDSTAFSSVNLTGVTQLRLEFQLDDNDDLGDDYLTFYSGNYDAQADRPHLLVEYYVQK